MGTYPVHPHGADLAHNRRLDLHQLEKVPGVLDELEQPAATMALLDGYVRA